MWSSAPHQNVSDLAKSDLLDRANQFIFSTGLNDGASKLCRANMKYGLAQFHLIQEKYGFEPKATFITSPDETISRNAFRWNSGIGYGGRLNWGSGNEKIVFLNVKPNCCGILVGGLDEPVDPYNLITQIDKIKNTNLFHDGIELKMDFGTSNHFINCYETKNLSDHNLPPYMFFIHGSAPEFMGDNGGEQLGLYVDKSSTLNDLALSVNTKFGKQNILLDSDAKIYNDFNKKAQRFSSSKRIVIANELFGDDFLVICNQPHQFLKDFNNMYLGCNCTDLMCESIINNIFPTTLRADLPAYLFSGKQNLSETTIKNLQFEERARRLEVFNNLWNVNILPHGGGYTLPDIGDVNKIFEYGDDRYFICELSRDAKKLKIIRNVQNLQYGYRGRKIILKTLQLKLGDLIARLKPIFSLKV